MNHKYNSKSMRAALKNSLFCPIFRTHAPFLKYPSFAHVCICSLVCGPCISAFSSCDHLNSHDTSLTPGSSFSSPSSDFCAVDSVILNTFI